MSIGMLRKVKDVTREVARKAQQLQIGVMQYYSLEDQNQPPDPEVLNRVNTPRIFNLKTDESSSSMQRPLHFYVLGCAGDGKEGQKKVADMMNLIAKNSEAPQFFVMLGDNFYDNGVDSASDPRFESQFHDVYHHPSHQYISGIPYFVVLGNHDHNLHSNFSLSNPGNIEGKIDFKKMAAQVEHTFLGRPKDFLKENDVHINDLRHWNMPSHFYLVRWHNIEMFFIDSNTYAKDYLASFFGDPDPNNQATWLQTHAQNPDTIKMLFLHHPVLTVGKRFYDFDTNTYLSHDDVRRLKEVYAVQGGYNEILRQIIFEKQNISFDSVFAAHDHVMSYHLDRNINKTLCQVTAGGGGGSLQYRETAKDWEKMPFFASDHGFVSVKVTPDLPEKKITFDFHYSLNHYRHLQFDNQNVTPILTSESAHDDAGFEELRTVFLKAYALYMDNSSKRTQGQLGLERITEYHGPWGLSCADNLRNILNNYKQVNILEFMELMQKSFEVRLTQPVSTSLSTIFKTLLLEQLNITYEDYLATHQVDAILPSPSPKDDSSPSQPSQTTTLFTPVLSAHSPHLFFSHGNTSPASVGLITSASEKNLRRLSYSDRSTD
jgi:hypothetical protein